MIENSVWCVLYLVFEGVQQLHLMHLFPAFLASAM